MEELQEAMKIENFDLNYTAQEGVSLYDEIFEKRQIGFVLRNFLNEEEIALVKQGLEEYGDDVFEIFPGYKALPRPFDYTITSEQAKYYEEAKYLETNPTMRKIQAMWKEKLAKISNGADLIFAGEQNDYSYSKGWSSYRELEPNQGLFELHCGNVFRLWNKKFFDHQYENLSQVHLSCVVMINKPETDEDIVIYKPHFDEYPEKISDNQLLSKNNEKVYLDDLEDYTLKLNAGDLLLFDESNYWHVVPKFGGTEKRLTFGGFLSKFLGQDKYMLWA